MESRRAESFSDGVFAVAITVLVFNLLPLADKKIGGFGTLVGYWPQYSAYVVSFLSIGIMWLNHHTMLSYVRRVDRVTLVLNTLLLMGVVAVPFPTALIADSLGSSPHVSARVAAVAYGLLLIVISLAYSVMWLYLSSHQATLGARPMRTPFQATVRFSAGLIGYVAGTLVALVWPDAAVAIYGVIAVYYLFEHLPDPYRAGAAGLAGETPGEAAPGDDAAPGDPA